MIQNPVIAGKSLPDISNPGTAADLLTGKQLIGPNGEVISGSMPSVVQATPSITVSSGGLITAKADQSGGKVDAGSRSATHQLTTQGGKTVTPGTSQQTAVYSGRYTTGDVYVAGDPDLKPENIKSGVNIFGVAGTAKIVEPPIGEMLDYISKRPEDTEGAVPEIVDGTEAGYAKIIITVSKDIKELCSIFADMDDGENQGMIYFPVYRVSASGAIKQYTYFFTAYNKGAATNRPCDISVNGTKIEIEFKPKTYEPFYSLREVYASTIYVTYIPK